MSVKYIVVLFTEATDRFPKIFSSFDNALSWVQSSYEHYLTENEHITFDEYFTLDFKAVPVFDIDPSKPIYIVMNERGDIYRGDGISFGLTNDLDIWKKHMLPNLNKGVDIDLYLSIRTFTSDMFLNEIIPLEER